MGDEKDAIYVVRKGDIVGVYKSFADCQAQAGFSPLDPSISVYKGYGLSKEAESYLVSRGLKQPVFSISASDVQDGLFGALSVCQFQDVSSHSSSAKQPVKLENHVESHADACLASAGMPVTNERIQKQASTGIASFSASSQQKRVKLKDYTESRNLVHPTQMSGESSSFVADPHNRVRGLKNHMDVQQGVRPTCESCTIEFDGASKGNPGPAGAGAVLRATDGSEVWRLREGVGIATNNVAEYRSVILGLKVALQKGFKHVHVRGDSLLVCNQIQGKWKTKNENMANFCKEASELKKQFPSFTIGHVAREFNSDADALANRAVDLRDGQVEMEVTRSNA